MRLQMSRRGETYLATVQSLLGMARKMTDMAVAGRLEALANDYQRRAEKASADDVQKASERRQAALSAAGMFGTVEHPELPPH